MATDDDITLKHSLFYTAQETGLEHFLGQYGFRPCPAFILTFSTAIRSSKTWRGSTLPTATRLSRRPSEAHAISWRAASGRTRTCRGKLSSFGTTMARRSRRCRLGAPCPEG